MAYNDKHRKRVKFVLLTCSWLTHLNGHFKVLSFLDSFTGSTHAYTQTHTERIWMCEPVCVCVRKWASEWVRKTEKFSWHSYIDTFRMLTLVYWGSSDTLPTNESISIQIHVQRKTTNVFVCHQLVSMGFSLTFFVEILSLSCQSLHSFFALTLTLQIQFNRNTICYFGFDLISFHFISSHFIWFRGYVGITVN